MDRLEIKRMQVLHALEQTDGAHEPLEVQHVMTAAPTTVNEQTNALELVRLLQKHGFRHLLVTDDADRLAGVLSDRDVIRCFGPSRYPDEHRLAEICARDIMSRDVITVRPETRLEVAVDTVVTQGISCLPVVTAGRVLGILTNTDLHLLLQALLKSDLTGRAAQPADRSQLVHRG